MRRYANTYRQAIALDHTPAAPVAFGRMSAVLAAFDHTPAVPIASNRSRVPITSAAFNRMSAAPVALDHTPAAPVAFGRMLAVFTLLAACLFCVSGAPAWAAPETSSESVAEAAGEAGGAVAGEVAAAATDATTEAKNTGIILPGGSTNAVDPRQTPDNSFLYDTSIAELTNADSSYQGNIVQVTGEVIGDAIRAEEDSGKHWITLESLEEGSANSISVLIDDSYLGLIDTYGAYGRIGTTLQIRGVFHFTCTSHEGIMDIHADTVKLVSSGVTMEQTFDIDDFTPGIAFVVLGLILVLLYRHLREKER